MRRLLLFVLVGMSGGLALADVVRVGFEAAEGYEVGSRELGKGWKVSQAGLALIGGDPVQCQFLKIEPGTPVEEASFVSQGVPKNEIRFVDFLIKPVAMEREGAQTVLNVWGSSVGFVKDSTGHIEIAAVDGKKEMESKLFVTGQQVGAYGMSDQWIRLTIRQDLKAGTWDLYVDGKLVTIDVGMDREGLGEFVIFGNEKASTYLDSLSVGSVNPLFVDSDRDGISDAEEIANGLNAFGDDRMGDFDADGVSNIEEVLRGTSPRAPGGMQIGANIYVDNRNGNDANRGLRSYPVGGDGPKASLKEAMAAARDGDTIVILPGLGVYDEGSRGEPGKRLTIKALSNVTIR